MSRAVKELIEADLKRRYSDTDTVMVVSVHGLKGTEVNELRGELRKKDIEVHVIHNRLARRILNDTTLAPLGAALEGPCAFVTGGPSAPDTAKELLRLAKEYPAFEMRVGLVDGDPDLYSIEDISKRKTKDELYGEIVMIAISPARKIAGCLNMGGKVAGCIKAIVDKLEKGDPITKVA